MTFARDYFIHYYQVDLNLNLTVVALLRILEDMAILHSDERGLGLKYYEEYKLGWMLSRWHIKINRLPRFKETVHVITEPKAFRKFYANRFYTVYGQSKNLLVDAKTLWAFVNTETRKLTPVNEDMYKGFHVSDDADSSFTKLESVPAIEKVDHQKTFNVRISDIDINQHVNNTQYVAWAVEPLPIEILQNFSLTKLSVNYLKETGLNSQVESEVEIKKNDSSVECIHSIKSDTNELCRAKSRWTKNQIEN